MGGLNIGPGGALGGAAGLGLLAGLFPNTSKTGFTNFSQTGQTGTQETDVNLQNLLNTLQNLTGTTTSTTGQAVTPTLSPETQALLSRLITSSGALTTPSLTGYSAAQTANINANADAQRQAVANIMASRGVGTSPVAATAEAGIEQNRLNQITGMQQQIPILQNQLNLANLSGATGLFSTIPKGATTTGTQTGTTQQTSSGTQIGQQTGGTGTTTNETSTTKGSGTGTQQSGGGVGGAVQGAAAGAASILPWLLLGGLFSDKNLKKDIKELTQDKAIAKIRELKGRTWKWKGGETEDSGVIAQEVEKVLPELVHTTNVDNLKAVNYAGIIPYLIGAIQNLDNRIEAN